MARKRTTSNNFNPSDTPLDVRQRAIHEQEAKLRAQMEKYQKLIEEAPKLAKERERARREEFITRAARTEHRYGSRAALPDNRYDLNVGVPTKQRRLRRCRRPAPPHRRPRKGRCSRCTGATGIAGATTTGTITPGTAITRDTTTTTTTIPTTPGATGTIAGIGATITVGEHVARRKTVTKPLTVPTDLQLSLEAGPPLPGAPASLLAHRSVPATSCPRPPACSPPA